MSKAIDMAFKQGRKEREDEILAIIRDYVCAFAPTINFRDWLIKQIKEGEQK